MQSFDGPLPRTATRWQNSQGRTSRTSESYCPKNDHEWDSCLGATITGPQADLNLGIQTYLDGALASTIVLDTSAAATDTIDYVVTDGQGLASTSSRTVIVEPATLPPPSTIATSSSATTTAQ